MVSCTTGEAIAFFLRHSLTFTHKNLTMNKISLDSLGLLLAEQLVYFLPPWRDWSLTARIVSHSAFFLSNLFEWSIQTGVRASSRSPASCAEVVTVLRVNAQDQNVWKTSELGVKSTARALYNSKAQGTVVRGKGGGCKGRKRVEVKYPQNCEMENNNKLKKKSQNWRMWFTW